MINEIIKLAKTPNKKFIYALSYSFVSYFSLLFFLKFLPLVDAHCYRWLRVATMGCRMWQGCDSSSRHAPIVPFLIYGAGSRPFRLQEPVACSLGCRAESRCVFLGATHKFFRHPKATIHRAGVVAVADDKQYPNGRTQYSPQLSAPTLRR